MESEREGWPLPLPPRDLCALFIPTGLCVLIGFRPTLPDLYTRRCAYFTYAHVFLSCSMLLLRSHSNYILLRIFTLPRCLLLDRRRLRKAEKYRGS